MMRICAVVFAWVWLFTINATADEITDSELRRTLNNVSHEFATCAGFYTLAAICLGEQDQGLTQQSRDAAIKAVEFAGMAGHGIGIKDETVIARVELAVKDMQDQTSHDCIKFSIVLNRYAAGCKAKLEDPQGFLRQRTARAMERLRGIAEKDKNETQIKPAESLGLRKSILPD